MCAMKGFPSLVYVCVCLLGHACAAALVIIKPSKDTINEREKCITRKAAKQKQMNFIQTCHVYIVK